MPASEKAKWVLSEDPIEAMELYFENLGIKDMTSFYGIKNMAGLEQHRAFKKRYTLEAQDKIQRMKKIWAEELGIRERLTQK